MECEITTMYCGNITQGQRKEEDCSLEIRALLPASVENVCFFSLLSGFAVKAGMVIGGVHGDHIYKPGLQSSISELHYVCTTCVTVSMH